MKSYYATMTGNAESLALNLAKKAQEMGYTFPVAELDSVEPAAIQEDTSAVFIVSTWGDGEPSLDAEAFWEQLREGDFNLSRLQYGVREFWRFALRGYIAWLAWLGVHLVFLLGMRNRITVFLHWVWSYVTWRRGARIITKKRPLKNSEP